MCVGAFVYIGDREIKATAAAKTTKKHIQNNTKINTKSKTLVNFTHIYKPYYIMSALKANSFTIY